LAGHSAETSTISSLKFSCHSWGTGSTAVPCPIPPDFPYGHGILIDWKLDSPGIIICGIEWLTIGAPNAIEMEPVSRFRVSWLGWTLLVEDFSKISTLYIGSCLSIKYHHPVLT
jgi:hypothetical protein